MLHKSTKDKGRESREELGNVFWAGVYEDLEPIAIRLAYEYIVTGMDEMGIIGVGDQGGG